MTAKSNVFRISNLDASAIKAECDRTVRLLQAFAPAEWISEVGSTSIEGVLGKQDIDILLLAPRAEFAALRERLDQVLRRDPDQLSNEQYQGYIVDSALDVSVQLTVKDGPY